MPNGRVPNHLRLAWFAVRATRSIQGVILLVACLFTVAATTQAVVDVLQWKDQVHQARSVLSNKAASEHEKRESIVVLQRDALVTLRSLREAAEQGGPNGEQASVALRRIEDASRR